MRERERQREIFVFSGSQLVRTNTALAADTTFSRRSEVLDSALIIGQTPASSKIRDGFSIRKMFQGNLSSGGFDLTLLCPGYLSELNIWDKELSLQQIESMRKCQSFQQGNLITWNKQNLRIEKSGDNLKIENVVDMSQFCNRRQYFIIPKSVDLATAYDQCKIFGGHIVTPTNPEENAQVLSLVKAYPQCLSNYS